MEKNPNPGKQRIKNITKDVEAYKQNPEDTKDIARIKRQRARRLSVNQSTQPMFSEQEEREIQELADHIADMSKDFAGAGSESHSDGKHVKPSGHRKSAGHTKSGRRPGAGSQLVPKLTAVILVLVVTVVAVLVMRNYGAGAASDTKGNQRFLEEDYAGAAAAYQQALDYDQKNSSYYIHLGMAYTGLGDYENAMAAFASARAYTNDSKLLQMTKRGEGIVYLYQGYYSKAEELFKEALGKLDGTYTDQELDILYYLAEAQDRSGDAVGAVLTYTEIINQKPDAEPVSGILFKGRGTV